MNSRFTRFSLVLTLFTGISLFSCSSGEDTPDNNTNTNQPSGVIPPNSDNGNNNNSEPDNKPETGSGNPQESTWNLVFEDNFSSSDSIPNQNYWTLAQKGTDTWNRYMSESYGQAYQKDGYLYLFGMQSNGEYLTGGIESIHKFDFKYGQMKCRARFLRQPQGNHTGIWMMPSPPAEKWPRSGEIDVMEHLDNQSHVFETVHFWNQNEDMDDKDDAKVDIDNDDFNIYGIIWDNESVEFTINGEVKFTYKNDNPGNTDFSYQYPFTTPFYLILSQSLGGEGTWEGVIDNDELPAVFQIDWVKVWQKSE